MSAFDDYYELPRFEPIEVDWNTLRYAIEVGFHTPEKETPFQSFILEVTGEEGLVCEACGASIGWQDGHYRSVVIMDEDAEHLNCVKCHERRLGIGEDSLLAVAGITPEILKALEEILGKSIIKS